MRMPRVASVMIAASIFSAGLALAATAATVTCKDGTTGPGGRGACRGHGGIDKSASSGSTTGAPSAAEEATTVTCKDGTTSKGGRGACRGHGGIAKAGEAERAPEAEGAATTVTCKDGATSKGGRGACRGHGGIAKAGETIPAPPRASRTPPPVPPTGVPPSESPRARATPPAQVAETTHHKAASTDPTGAIARCKDGVYWHSTHHQGACSRHGGVDSWMDGTR